MICKSTVKKCVIACIALLIFCKSAGEGFVAGTIVRTPNGHTPIEKLNVQDVVIAYDYKNSLVAKPIISLFHHTTPYCVRIWISDDYIDVAPDQKFFLPIKNIWVTAQNLTVEDILLSDTDKFIKVSYIEIIHEKRDVYSIQVDCYHNFYVTHHNILAHNFIPFVAIGFSWFFGAGAIEFAGATITAGISAAGVYLLAKINTKKHKKDTHQVTCKVQVHTNGFNGFNGNNDKDPERKSNHCNKTEFFKNEEVKKNYEYDKTTNSYKLKRRGRAIGSKKTQYIKWDHTHNDVEGFGADKKHLGSIDPIRFVYYKDPVFGRELK